MIKTVYVNIPSYIEDSNYRYKMPKPQLKIEGRGNGIKTNIMNLHEIAKALNCHDQYPLKYLGFEFGSQTSYKFKNDNDVTCIINGAFQDDQIRKQLDKFIEKYILCQKCRYPEMYMKIKGGKIIYGQCDSCGHVSDLDNTHRLASYILKNPPGGNQSIKNGQDEVQMINSEGQSGNKEDKQKKKKIVAAEVGLDSELLETFLIQIRDTYNRLVVNEKIDNDVADMMITQDIKKFNLDRHLKDRVCYLIFQSMFDENPTKAFERNYELLTTYFNDLDPQLAQCHMILNIQYLMKKRNIDDKYFGTVLKGFYDYSYVEEQYLIKWFENSEEWKNEAQQDFLYNEQLDNHYRKLSEPMINWMKSQAGQEEEYYEEEVEDEQADQQQ
ncbi:unnamed protein product [Paramecium primaurelia]|uniref:W2 domain-containing protein n=1 Tax=Paramecium primaurelia TaxID=5886 RepID=A0A8S1N6G4_PARPR|nr:unnamed protein product [Paramecium primaurelia]